MKHLLLTTIAAVLVVGCAPSVDIWEAAKEGNIEAVKQHLATGTDVNAIDDDWTPFKYAAHEGHKEITELLIAAYTDVNAKDNRSGTPLHFAASQGWKESPELLITAGAEVNEKDNRGRTPLDSAILFKEIETAALLRKNGGKTAEELKA